MKSTQAEVTSPKSPKTEHRTGGRLLSSHNIPGPAQQEPSRGEEQRLYFLEEAPAPTLLRGAGDVTAAAASLLTL